MQDFAPNKTGVITEASDRLSNGMDINKIKEYVSLSETNQFDQILVLDGEYTCWENSLRTNWIDRNYPCELIQIAMVVYKLRPEQCLAKYLSYVQPLVNPKLSTYCKDLLSISQGDVDNAPTFFVVAKEMSDFIQSHAEYSLFPCAWGDDCEKISEQANRHKTWDPFASLARMNLMKEALNVFRIEGNYIARDEIREKLCLPPIANRHNALADALDLLDVMKGLINYQSPVLQDQLP